MRHKPSRIFPAVRYLYAPTQSQVSLSIINRYPSPIFFNPTYWFLLVAVNAIASVNTVSSLSHGTLQGSEDIVLQVLGILNTAADADKVVKDPHGLALVLRDAGVGHAAWHFAQAFNTSQGLGKSKDFG